MLHPRPNLKNAWGFAQCRSFSVACFVAIRLPYLPWCFAAAPQIFELLLIFKGIHGGPEAVIRVTNQLLFVDKPLKRPVDKFLFFADVIEDFVFEDKKASIDAHSAIVDGMNPRDQVAIALMQRDHVIAEVRPDRKKTGSFSLLSKVVQLLWKRQVSEAITVVGKEFFFAFQVFLNCL